MAFSVPREYCWEPSASLEHPVDNHPRFAGRMAEPWFSGCGDCLDTNLWECTPIGLENAVAFAEHLYVEVR